MKPITRYAFNGFIFICLMSLIGQVISPSHANAKNSSPIKKNFQGKESQANRLLEKYRTALEKLAQGQAALSLKLMPDTDDFIKAGLPTDRLMLTMARAQYQTGDFTNAIESYSQIPQSSDLWLTAREERAHTYGKSGQYDKAIADFTTLFSPVFENTLSPEAYFTAALTYLRICQYNKVFETLHSFKEKMKTRINDLNALKNRQADMVVLNAVQELISKPYHTNAYAKYTGSLPVLFHLDFVVRDQIQKIKKNSKSDSSLLLKRVSEMAREDLSDIKVNLNKLQLVEAEVMQRIHLAEKVKNNKRNDMGEFKADSDQLFFPYNGEVWIDELDSYQVQSKGCPTSGGGA